VQHQLPVAIILKFGGLCKDFVFLDNRHTFDKCFNKADGAGLPVGYQLKICRED
jgi:hypothetical protein